VNDSAKCPLCDSRNTNRVEKLDADLLVRKWAELYRIDVVPEFHGLRQIERRQCCDCSLGFFLPESVCGSGTLYGELERFGWYYPRWRWEHEQASRELRGRRRGLEIGCGQGGFLRGVTEKAGIAMEGVEQNPRAIDECRALGLDVRAGKIEELAAEGAEPYDAVCSFQVLEHVPDPGRFLRACCDILRPGGLLILGLPNAKSFLGLQFNLLDMPPHHMSRWQTQTLERLTEIFPLRIRRIAREPLASAHIDGYVETHGRILGDGAVAKRFGPAIKTAAARTLRNSGLHRLLRGQGLYACYERT
jgi:SAM-dependent methyltransferase